MSIVKFEDYQWPAAKGITPFAHQRDSVIFLLTYKRAYNFSDLGTGKTLSHLWCADFLMVNGKLREALVISPLSTMQSVWAREIFLNFPHRRYSIAHGTRQERINSLRKSVDFHILNHDGVKIPEVEKEIIRKINNREIGLIIIDELTAFKKHTTDRSKAMIRIAQACGNVCGIHGLTGAPTPNGPVEAFGQAKVVTPNNPALPRYFKQFQQMVEYQVGPYLWKALDTANLIVEKILRPAIRFKRDDCIDIPECQYINVELGMSKEQELAYKAMRQDLLVEFESGLITASNAAVKYMKLLQIAAGSVKDDTGNPIFLDSSPRDSWVLDVFQELPDKKLVIFTAFRSSITHLENMFKNKGIKCESIHGSVDHKVRAARIRDFQDGDLEVLVIQPQSSAHGITLTKSCTIIWYSLIASGEIHVQANGRITRAGQKKKQTIYYPVSCPAEKSLLNNLQKKETTSLDLLGLFEEI